MYAIKPLDNSVAVITMTFARAFAGVLMDHDNSIVIISLNYVPCVPKLRPPKLYTLPELSMILLMARRLLGETPLMFKSQSHTNCIETTQFAIDLSAMPTCLRSELLGALDDLAILVLSYYVQKKHSKL
ncbi:14228_t:CDS:2 [Funneliformis caledonium]|uniref:14228_t:CDS:1 n=1 Tax=Funneliformis caledonium TaxID=1117310 RepID=A0A9N8Z764_9GLOM|nr:14228_t:CDS:2 [Funneliformis caledonium]